MSGWKKPVPGGPVELPLSSSFMNELLERVTRHPLDGSGQPSTGAGPKFTAIPEIKNRSTREVPRGGVLQLEQPIYSFTEAGEDFLGGEPKLQGVAPDEGAKIQDIAIALETMEPNDVKRMGILGWYPARVDILDESHRAAQIIDQSVMHLQSAEDGIAMMPGESGTGVKWALVYLGPRHARATIEGALAVIKGTVPAASGIDPGGTLVDAQGVGKQVVTFGELPVSAGLTTFTEGALLINPDGTAVVREGGFGPQIYAVDVLNPRMTQYIGEGPGVAVAGSLAITTEDDGQGGEITKRRFLLPTSEMRTVPGFVLGASAIADAQGIAHMGGSRAEVVGRNECV